MNAEHYNKLIKEYISFLANYTTNVDKVGYNNENGYPLEDALFDRILFCDFCQYLKKDDKMYRIWVKLSEELDDEYNVVADDVFAGLCELTKTKVEDLLRKEN